MKTFQFVVKHLVFDSSNNSRVERVEILFVDAEIKFDAEYFLTFDHFRNNDDVELVCLNDLDSYHVMAELAEYYEVMHEVKIKTERINIPEKV